MRLDAVLLAAGALTAASPLAAAPSIPYRIAVLQGLDKVTARTTIIEAPVGRESMFGRLGITPRACLKTPPTEPPESAAFLEIRSLEPGEPPRTDFTGWMMASSPALSALEHPVYDVWVIDCSEPADGGAVSPPTTPRP